MAATPLPAKYTFSCWQAATFRQLITVLPDLNSPPTDLTGYEATMNIRLTPDATPVYTLSTTSGDITLGGTAGTIGLYISATNTADLPNGLYDLSIVADAGTGDTDVVLWGPFRVLGTT